MTRSRRRGGLWATLGLVALLGTASPSRGDTYAFLVGVSEYERKDELKALRFASDDVIAFAGVLRNAGVPARNIVLMHDRQSNPRFRPSGKNIQREFHLLLATLEPDDSLVVAMAGHGVEVGQAGESFFLPADADLKDPATLINIKAINEEIEKSQAGLKLLLVDACRNDPEADNARGLGVTVKPPRRLSEAALPRGSAALFSCNSEQRSFEDPVLRHGIFFHQVIRAWEGGADLDGDRRITLEELETFVRRETKTHARDALSAIQTPVFRGDHEAAKAWVVASLAGPRPSAARAGAGAGAVEIVDRAEAMRRRGEDAAAEREFARAIQADPNSAKAHLGLARLHHAKGRLPQAAREYSEAIRTDPADAAGFVGRATALGAQGDLRGALADYERAIQINRDLAVAFVGQGAILTRLNRAEDAIAACTRAIEIDPGNAKAYYNRAIAREATGDKAGSAEDFRKAARLDSRLGTP
ncbi:Tetratricopeptide repeat protein [Aquisphaera giovannonii]|uniref:Tetratricopeptide repeat protein n=1 Tax=Aquisphaera giovannonii TaxID=406548 RepID=A0A5B9WEY7_9BACT|nr:tetratricopeptide repeat protein [Aquisphaera giovannonii]QEH38794.1 Tetratricopeptide repeat protein [Aquisphaera giovannonii]